MLIPADIPPNFHQKFQENYNAITKNSENLFLFAGDHKLEKLNLINPEYLFQLAAQPEIGAFATHLGLVSRYGKQYPTTNYIVKLNGKSDALKTLKYRTFFMPTPMLLQEHTILHDPVNRQLWNVEDVVTFQKNSGLNIRGVGYTVYLGSTYEADMLREAARIVFDAHQHGLVTFLWMYPRGYSVKNERDGALIAGAAGVAAELGADFAKVKAPSHNTEQWLKKITESAGNTRILLSGGEKYKDANDFMQDAKGYLTKTAIAGFAVGRNIFELERSQAQDMIKHVSKLVYGK